MTRVRQILSATILAAIGLGVLGWNVPAEARRKKAAKRTAEHVIEPGKVYDIGISFDYPTTVWMPVDCRHPIVGATDLFSVAVVTDEGTRRATGKSGSHRRFLVLAAADTPGSSTSVTLECDKGVRLALRVVQVPASRALISVTFKLDAEREARVAAAVAEATKQCDARLAAEGERLADQAKRQLLRGALKRIGANDDTEAATDDFVTVYVRRQFFIGDDALIVFEVRNKTESDFHFGDAIVRSGPNQVFKSTLEVAQPRIPPHSAAFAIVSFTAPVLPAHVELEVQEQGPRRIILSDIEFQ